MEKLAFVLPRRLVFGPGTALDAAEYLISLAIRRVFLVTAPQLTATAAPIVERVRAASIDVVVYDHIDREPTVAMFMAALAAARDARADAVVGFGGGSCLDVAKLLAAMADNKQVVHDVFGTDRLSRRRLHLVCLPTTAGTGSEVSQNSLLFDEADNAKKAVISKELVSDATFVDPILTYSMPPAATASTGMDALTHCVETYANLHAHPMVDLYALDGIRRISNHLQRAVDKGDDGEARDNVALGSLYGGLGLGPVNTAAVHALAYPLAIECHLPHGLANALLLPHVLGFNLSSAPQRYAQVALAMGAKPGDSDLETAKKAVECVNRLLQACRLPTRLSQVGVSSAVLGKLPAGAMNVTRLLKNNLRQITLKDAESIYREAF
jgi:alcohol dehydrogenase